jgi:hypothetical protein
MRIIVIGGTGFLGARTVRALQQFPDLTVEVASRRGPVVVDITRPETFEVLRGADVVVDVSNGTRSAPDALAAWCLEQGVTLLETTSDAEAVRRLADALSSKPGPGRVVLGGGLFTGISNLLSRAVAHEAGAGCQLTFAVSSSPYSGAGAGTIALMVDGAARPAVRTVNGRREEVPLSRGPIVSFATARRPSLRASLAEAELLPRSTGARDVDVFFAPRPGFLVTAFVMLPQTLMRQRWFQWGFELAFTVLRRVLLRAVPSAVELMARAERDGVAVERHVTCDDGMDACAWAIAAMAEALALSPPPAGVRCIDDVVGLEAIVARVNAVAGRAVLVVR